MFDLAAAEASTSAHEPPTAPRIAAAAYAPPPAAGLGDLQAPLSGSNPFANLLQGAPPPAASRDRPATRAAPAASSASRLPDDFDPFGEMPAPAPAPATPAEAPRGRGAFGDLIPDAGPSSLDDLFGLGRAGTPDLLTAFASEAPAPSTAGAATPSVDPLVLFDRERRSAPVVPTDPTIADDVPEIRAAYRPPRPLPAAAIDPDPAPPARTRPAPVRQPTAAASDGASDGAADGAALWAAFCEGARLRPERGRDLDVDAMRSIGALLRAAVDGTMQLITVRSATRHELHAQVTVIKPRDNNPLKFSPDPQSALEQLLQPPLRGFLAGPEAMSDAMADLVGHAIGSMAGTRAALEGVLGRFVPDELEAKMETKSLLDSVLPGHRKARLWELYRQHFGAIREEAQEDFHTLFGKAFLAAYEQQLERLARDRASTSP